MKDPTVPSNLCVSILLLLLLASVTACTSLLKSNFNGDTTGNPPDKSLPGSPSGDAITYNVVIEPLLKVTVTGFPSKALEYKNLMITDDISGHYKWLNFKAKSTNLTKPITFTWSAIANFPSSGAPLLIDLSDGSGALFARIRIEGTGKVMLADDWTDFTEVGTISAGQNILLLLQLTHPLENII